MSSRKSDRPVESHLPRVLVIDDDANFTKALAIKLRALGIAVIAESTARAGAHRIWSERPDLIITDQNMPEMSGKTLIARLKELADTRDIPVIMITGQTQDGHEDWGLKSEMLDRHGAVAYLTKPVDYRQLVEVLSRYLRLPRPAA